MTILSSSSLFHYTKSLDNLISILSSGFRYSTVREPYPQIGWGNSPFTALGLQRTFVDNNVVCFCDIPLTQAIEHRRYYNSYAIGLSKEWAKLNHVTPVRYVHSNSPGFSGKIMELMEIHYNQKDLQSNFLQEYIRHKCNRSIDIDRLSDEARFVIKALEDFLTGALDFIASGSPFFKAYEIDDPLQQTPTKKYYDEREWRAYSVNPDNNNLTFSWPDIDFILCATKYDCDVLYKQRKHFVDFLQIKPVSRIWQKLFSFEEIDANF